MALQAIACCTDFSGHAHAAFEHALDLADKYEAKLYVIHVLPPAINPLLTEVERLASEEPELLLSRLQAKMQEEYEDRIGGDVDHELVVLSGHVSSEIIRFLKEKSIDLVLMGSYGLSGMGLVLFGSVAKRVTRNAPCSVMIVREKESGAGND
jgi:universal stress protein A